MAFCSKCGTQIDQGSAFCQNCGAPAADTGAQVQAATAPPPAPTAQPAAAGKTNGLALTALIIGIASLFFDFFYFIPSILAIVLGIIGFIQVKRTGVKGKGMAVGGIVLGAVAILLWIILMVAIGLAIGSLSRM